MKKKTFIRPLSLHAPRLLAALSLLLALAACQNENDNLPSTPDTDPAAGGSLRLTTPVVTLDATADAINPAARTRGAGTVDFSAMTLQIRLVKADRSDYLQQEASYTYTAPADGSTTPGTWSLTTSSAPAVSAPGNYRLRALAHLTRAADGLPMLAYFDDLSTISTDGTTTGSGTTTPAHFTLALRPAAAQLCLRLKDANGRIITDGSSGSGSTNADAATFASLKPNAAALQHALLPAAITNDADAANTWSPAESAVLPLGNTNYDTKTDIVYLDGPDARYFVLPDVYPGGTPSTHGLPGPGINIGTTLFSLTHLDRAYNIVLPTNGKALTLAAGTRTTLTVSLSTTDATVEKIEIEEMEDEDTSIDLGNSGICPIGTGSNGQETYAVANVEGLQAFANLVLGTAGDGTNGNPALNCVLTADIKLLTPDANDSNWTALGTSRNRYTGTFDGGGHTVSGLVINQPSAGYQGFFGYIGTPSSSVTVKNLTVEGTVNGQMYIGGIIGCIQNSIIENCVSRVEVTGTGMNSYIGGVVGYNQSGTVIACYNTGNVSGGSYVGGVVGYNNSTVIACYSTGSVSGNSSVGGVVGRNTGTITTCFWQSINSQPSNGSGEGTDTGTTDVTTYTAADNLKEQWRLACGEYQLSSDGTLNKAIYDWNADKTEDKANQFCPYCYAENPEYDNADAEAAAKEGKSYSVAPLILVPLPQ